MINGAAHGAVPLPSDEIEIEGLCAALVARLVLIARRDPAGPWHVPHAGTGGREAEGRRAEDVRQCPVRVILDVGREVEYRSRRQGTGEFSERRGGNEAAFVMARFGPGIGVEQPGFTERCRRKFDEKLQGIVGEEPDIADGLGIDGLDHLGDAAREHFAADEAGVGMGERLAHQMLAAAIADFDGDLLGLGEERGRIELSLGQRDLKVRQFLVKQPVLPFVQALARAAAEKGPRLAGDGERWRLGQPRLPSLPL